jgi:hypothetical protein
MTPPPMTTTSLCSGNTWLIVADEGRTQGPSLRGARRDRLVDGRPVPT